MTAPAVAPKRGRPTNEERETRGPLTTTVPARYLSALNQFINLLSEAQTEAAEGSGSVVAYSEPGRVYDKILCATFNRGNTHGEAEVRYFVHRESGIIYGAKSPQAPNLKQFRGTVFTARSWDWHGRLGEPKDLTRAGVRLIREYGDFKHYLPTDAETLAFMDVAEEEAPTAKPRTAPRKVPAKTTTETVPIGRTPVTRRVNYRDED